MSDGSLAIEGLAEKLGLRIGLLLHLIGNNSGSNYAAAGAQSLLNSAAITIDQQWRGGGALFKKF